MVLEEAREMATDLITVKDTPIYMRPMCEALMLLDNKLTEIKTERDELLVALQNLIENQSGSGEDFFRALKEAMGIVDKIKQSPSAIKPLADGI